MQKTDINILGGNFFGPDWLQTIYLVLSNQWFTYQEFNDKSFYGLYRSHGWVKLMTWTDLIWLCDAIIQSSYLTYTTTYI